MRERSSVRGLVVGLGSAQLVAWGTLYYAIAVLGEPMSLELRVSRSHVFGSFALGLLVSGVLAPSAGKALDRYGGRAVLITSAVLGAGGFTLLAHARSLPELIAAWSIAGVAMALGLYDACFAAIGQTQPGRYRRAVTGVTLIAGFASTVSWPLSHYLLQALGWRAVCHSYALAMLACAPLYWVVLSPAAVHSAPQHRAGAASPLQIDPSARRRLRILSWTFAGAALIGGSMSAHLVSVLNAAELPGDLAVWVASSIGVLQVLGRVLELSFGAKYAPATLGLVTFVGLAAAMLALLGVGSWPWLAFGFALLYGVANGLLTIAKATLPVEILGFERVGAVLGAFGAPSLVMRALAPLAFALVVDSAGTRAALVGVALVALGSLGSYVLATRS